MGVNRLVYQYRHAERFKALIVALYEEEASLLALQNSRLSDRLNIDTQVGVQLDGIGEFLGAPRPGIVEGEDEAFAFAGATSGLGFGEGRFISSFTTFDNAVPVNDVDYRPVLRAAQISNVSNSSILALEQFFMGALGIIAEIENGDGFVNIRLPRELRQFEQRIVDTLVPRAAGRVYNITTAEGLTDG